MTDQTPEQGSSRLAWELARLAKLTALKGGEVRATVTFRGGDQFWGTGSTSTAAIKDLARELDRWNVSS